MSIELFTNKQAKCVLGHAECRVTYYVLFGRFIMYLVEH